MTAKEVLDAEYERSIEGQRVCSGSYTMAALDGKGNPRCEHCDRTFSPLIDRSSLPPHSEARS